MSRTGSPRAAGGTEDPRASWSRTLHPPPDGLQQHFAQRGKLTRECVFRGNEMLREDINPRLQEAWKADGRKGYFPFSGAQKVWRTEHCPQINPYGSEDCPYGRDECSIAYFAAMTKTIDSHPDNFIAFARTVARNLGMIRSDNKPLARDRIRTSGHSTRRRSLRAGPREGLVDDVEAPGRSRLHELPGPLGEMEGRERPDMYRPSGFTRIGTLLGADDLRPHLAARRRDESEKATDNDGDRDGDLPSASPVDSVGGDAPTGDPQVPTGGE